MLSFLHSTCVGDESELDQLAFDEEEEGYTEDETDEEDDDEEDDIGVVGGDIPNNDGELASEGEFNMPSNSPGDDARDEL